MASNSTILCYFKVPFTEERATLKIPLCMTITQFLGLADVVLRELFVIHPKYTVQIVETNSDKGEYGPSLLPNDIQTVEQRFGSLSQPIAFYARPVDVETLTFVRQPNYTV